MTPKWLPQLEKLNGLSPYEFIGIGNVDDNFPYESMGFGAMDGKFPCEFKGLGDMYGVL